MNIEKFTEKNKENITKVDNLIEMYGDTIRKIITSTELFYFLLGYTNQEETVEGRMIYKGKQIIKDPYYPSHKIGFIMRNNEIDFDVPCLCGYYKGEGHNHLR